MSENENKNLNIKKILLAAFALIILSFISFTAARAFSFEKTQDAASLTSEEAFDLTQFLLSNYPEEHQTLKKLPYNIGEPQLDIWAKSAILIDVSNGNILYQKNADSIIPPASMTKLFAMYVVEEEIEAGRFSNDKRITNPPESRACKMPPHSSHKLHGKDQRVTMEELLLGLSICSGNDAAYALAYTVSGTMEAFVERMNLVAADLGLANTHFVESSGYSEKNQTTAREMAEFAAIYLRRHPDSLHRFHSVLDFTYPKQKNLAPGDHIQSQDFTKGFPQKITMPITQANTNPLLGKLEGCDGLKTGYIDESGYNLALTAVRGETRFLSVTMGGPGNSVSEGQAGRVHDGTELMEWAFNNFADYPLELKVHPYLVRSFNASQKMIRLIPAFTEHTFTVPYVSGNTMAENLDSVRVEVQLPDYCWGAVEQGSVQGKITISAAGYILQEIPLVADRSLTSGNVLIYISDIMLSKIFMYNR
ncbi:MAG: D-alanyl-D-alanine carboxypeptidase family protein [Treponema sp.]|nr:D-alanyl-D-alanine carboxypeptidase family protein [Treponema sp.]